MQNNALRVTIYFGEADRHHGKPLYLALLERLRAEGAMGATITRGIAGFGAKSHIHTARIVELSTDLPMKLEWADYPERVEAMLPALREMVEDGLITVEPVDIVQYAAGRHAFPLEIPVSEIMRTSVTTVSVDTPADAVVSLLIDRGYRSLPVLDHDNRVVGIITDGDLIEHASLPARIGLYGALPPAVIQEAFATVVASGIQAEAIMTEPVVTISPDDSLRLLVNRMNVHDLKRLPVVDKDERFVGLVTRLDLLRTLEYHTTTESDADSQRPQQGTTIAELMVAAPSTVSPQATLEEIVVALESSHQQRVIVVDGNSRVVGIITDGDILRRSQDGDNPGLLDRLRNAITGGEAGSQNHLAPDETATELMTRPVITISAATRLDEALRAMLRHQIKRLPVVDEQGKLLGLLGRTSLLHGLVGDLGQAEENSQ